MFMKTFFKMAIIAMIAVGGFAFAQDASAELAGTWQSDDGAVSYTIESNGDYAKTGANPESGTCTATQNEITFSSGSGDSLVCEYKIEGDKLTLTSAGTSVSYTKM
jgi:hypothetical protein